MRWLISALAVAVVPAALAAQGAAASDTFPHARHAKLFPTCAGCHGGIPTGDRATSFPPVTLCAACHDGTVEPRVQWRPPPAPAVGLLAFSHPTHLAKATGVTCATCHVVGDTSQWMNVAPAAPERCITCHQHAASGHLASDNVCATCHRPLTGAVGLSEAQIAALPKPQSHALADFVQTHGAMAQASASIAASCKTCHSRESCERCHVNGGEEPLIQALGTDARVARLEKGKAPVYPEPSDHAGAQFVLTHGATAHANPARCAICHARASCQTCHMGPGGESVLQSIPDARHATAPGVQLRHAPPAAAPSTAAGRAGAVVQATLARADTARLHQVTVHPAGFIPTHGVVAASGELECSGCHAQRFCSDCHAGENVTRRYHPANFLAAHAPQAYGREVDCTTCHSTETFCRACHRQAGLAAKTNARSTVFHNAQPLWLLQHGRAAREDLNSCTTCHQQTYCMQCHSDLGSRIDPHGPGFDAARMASKNPEMCLMCHFKNPLGG